MAGLRPSSASPGELLGSVDVYDPRTNVWTAASPMSVPRVAPASTGASGTISVVGGVFQRLPGTCRGGSRDGAPLLAVLGVAAALRRRRRR